MTQPHEDPFEAPEVGAMHVEDEGGLREPIDPDIDDEEFVRSENASPDDVEVDVEEGLASAQDMTMAESELEDQGEITAADQQFDA